jgi:hypothetical protein
MGFFSRFRSRRNPTSLRSPRPPRSSRLAEDSDSEPSLIRYRYDDPALADIERAAAADVEAVEQDDKYFGGQAPGNPEHDR